VIARADVIGGVRRSYAWLKTVNLSEIVRQYEPLEASGEFRDLALGGADTYTELYIGALRTGAYNIVLRDFSLFQFGLDDSGARYAFLPNPYLHLAEDGETINEAWELVEGGAGTLEDAIDYVGSIDSESGVPPIRYEASESQWKKLRHPHSHFHIGFHADNRWPVRRHLTPFAFTLLIAKMYYGSAWLSGCAPADFSPHEELLRAERVGNCRLVSPEYFPQEEELSFHFS
jgi:hypothetical protein